MIVNYYNLFELYYDKISEPNCVSKYYLHANNIITSRTVYCNVRIFENVKLYLSYNEYFN